jgi:hypothetical protein
MVYDGIYTWGAEVDVFSPCGTNQTYWVITSDPLRHELSGAHQQLTSKPYEGIFAEVTGFYAGPAIEEKGGAFSTQYDGLFQVTNVSFTRKRSSLDCARDKAK